MCAVAFPDGLPYEHVADIPPKPSVQTSMIAHAANSAADSVDQIAAWGAVNASLDFATGIFNFLFMVVMAKTGKAVGEKVSRPRPRS